MCLVEDPIGGAGGYEKVRIGIVAVMPSTGEIVWDGESPSLLTSIGCKSFELSDSVMIQNSKTGS